MLINFLLRHIYNKYWRIFTYSNILLLMVILVACQSGGLPVVSLEEAKQLTSDIRQQQRFAPPPRSIEDLVAEMDTLSEDSDGILANFRAKANSQIPTTKDLFQYYITRAESARMIGRYNQTLEDGHKALGLADNNEKRIWALRSIGNSHEELGDYRKALEYFEKGADLWGLSGQNISSHLFLAWGQALNGDFDGAEKSMAIARSRRSEILEWEYGREFIPINLALVDALSGTIHYLHGNYTEAERVLRAAIKLLEREIVSGGNNDRILTSGRTLQETHYLIKTFSSRYLSLTVMRQGRLAEAEALARDNLLTQARIYGINSGQTLEGLRAMSQILSEQGRFEEAERLIHMSLDIFKRMGVKADSVTLAVTHRILADNYVGQGRWRQAQDLYDHIARDLSARPDGLAHVMETNLQWAVPLIQLGRGAEAVERLSKIHSNFSRSIGDDHYLTAEALGMMASGMASQGREALDAFTKSVPVLLSRNNQSQSKDESSLGRMVQLRFILESYIRTLSDMAASGAKLPDGTEPTSEAFRVANAARGGMVKQALASSAARVAANDPQLADLSRREQSALQHISALNGILRNAFDNKTREELLERIRIFKSSRITLMKEITRQFPAYAEMIDPKPARLAEVQANLRPGESLIATYTTTDRTYVWAIPHFGPVAFNSSEWGAKTIANMVTGLRTSLDPRAETLGDIPSLDLETAYKLYKELLLPVATGWKDAKNLIVVAHGALGFLPFSVLPTKPVKLGPETKPLFSNYRAVPWLARSHAVTVLPSVASLQALRRLSPADSGRQLFVGFGDPYFNLSQASQEETKIEVADAGPTRGLPLKRRAIYVTTHMGSAHIGILPRLPDTAAEVREIALALKADLDRDVFLGKEASEIRIKSMDFTAIKVLVFATHGLLPGDLDGLTQPALAFTAPEVAGGQDDGLLTMGEILGLRLNADWVVLSACNTGAGQGKGEEAFSGLGQAFFYAGTRAILVSNWPVETTSAKTLTTNLFRRQATNQSLRRSEALNLTMLDLIDKLGYLDAQGRMVFSYAHPVFWAPFSLVGDGGK